MFALLYAPKSHMCIKNVMHDDFKYIYYSSKYKALHIYISKNMLCVCVRVLSVLYFYKYMFTARADGNDDVAHR